MAETDNAAFPLEKKSWSSDRYTPLSGFFCFLFHQFMYFTLNSSWDMPNDRLAGLNINRLGIWADMNLIY